MTSDTKRILLTGGGSGGHVYPLLAVTEALRKISKGEGIEMEISYLGPHDKYAKLFAAFNVPVKTVPAGKIRRYLSLQTLLDIPRFFIGLFAALFKMYWAMPDVVFSKGGTGALPVVISGWFYRIPIIIHESDAKPGLNNLLSAYFASRIAVSFEHALRYFNPRKVAWVGTPVRSTLLADRPRGEEAKENLGFTPNSPLVLILGGSLGSERINKFILTNLSHLASEAQILHQTGAANYTEAEKLSRAALIDIPVNTAKATRYKAVPYLEDDLKTALAAADLVISRAGSGTIFELAAFGKPAILIPLREAANDHQRINAHEFSRGGAAIVIEEQNLLPSIFTAQVKSVIHDQEKLKEMGAASQKFFKPDAAEVIARELLGLA